MVNYKVVYRLHLYLFYLPASYTLVHKPCRSSLKHITRLPWRIHELYFPFSQISGPASPAASPRMRWLTFHCILVPLCQISHVKYKNISLANFYVSQRPNTMHHIWGMCYMQVMLMLLPLHQSVPSATILFNEIHAFFFNLRAECSIREAVNQGEMRTAWTQSNTQLCCC